MFKMKTDTDVENVPTLLCQTSPPLRATLPLLIGERRQHPTPIRSQREQEELRKLSLDPEDAQHAAVLRGSHGRETTSVSHMPRRISGDLTALFPASLRRETGAPVAHDRNNNKAGVCSQRRGSVSLRTISQTGAMLQRDKYCVASP